jgi:hypothetical protein
MSFEVTAGHFNTTLTLSAGGMRTLTVSSSLFNKDRWQRLSVTPDNFPSRILIVAEWASTDVENRTTLLASVRNNGTNTVIFRAGYLVAPGI